mmetsp:Transcript_95537/g.150373  ORF Transcript_95537/g.150373 Transcript_95537/m.150373 type:complete len:679 (+) Transcript_95537:61-2097(+)
MTQANIAGQHRSTSQELKIEFDSRFQQPHADVTSHANNCLVEHVTVSGIPQLGKTPHASVGHGHINVSAVLGYDISPSDGPENCKLVQGGIETEAYRCCQFVEQVLRACCADWADLVWLMARIPSLTDNKVGLAEEAIDHFCREHGCPFIAKSIVGCDVLRNSANIELEAVAVTAYKDSFTKERESRACSSSHLAVIPASMSCVVAPKKALEETTSSPMPSSPPGLLAPVATEGLGVANNVCTPMRNSSKLERSEKASKDSALEDVSSAETTSPNQPPVSSEASSSTTSPPQQSSCLEDPEAFATNHCMERDVVGRDGIDKTRPALNANTSHPIGSIAEASNSSQRQRGKRGAKAAKSSDPQAMATPASIATALDRASFSHGQSVGDSLKVEVPREHQSQRTLYENISLQPFEGHVPSFCIEDVSTNKERNIMADFQLDGTLTYRVQMVASDNYQTVRLNPSELLCSRQEEKTSWAQKARGASRAATWRYEFDVALTKTRNCYVNIGLVEWGALTTQPALQLPACDKSNRLSLAELMGLKEMKTKDWQHATDNVRQRMLGCKKGVKWYGERQRFEPLLRDDVLEGSILRFQCDHIFDESGYLKAMKLWLVSSKVNYRWKEPKGKSHILDLDKPLFEWPSPGEHENLQVVWVPAVTLYNKDDAVLFSWTGRMDASEHIN